MYMSLQCTKFSNEAIKAIQQVNLNILLICNVCVSQNKHNVVIDRLKDKPEKVEETKETFKAVIEETMQKKIKQIELTKTSNKEASEIQSIENFKQVSDPKTELNVLIRGIDELNDKDLRNEHDGAEINNVFHFLEINTEFRDCKRVSKTSYKEDLENQSNENFKQVRDPKIELNILIRGFDKLNDQDLRIEHDGAEINNVSNFLEINAEFTDCKRVSKYKPERHRCLLVTMPSVFDKKLLHSSLARLKNFYKRIYINRELRRSEARKTNSGCTVESNKIFSSALLESDLDHLGPKDSADTVQS